MEHNNNAAEDFREARRRAAMEGIVARLTGRSVELLSFEDVRRKLKVEGGEGREKRQIPLGAIVGSVGRYNDFSRSFLPQKDSDRERWTGVKTAMKKSTGLPPIDVYQIDQVYFVLDGNHRVSVARQQGADTIEAFVTVCQTKVPLGPDVKPDDLIVKAEYADFLDRTGLDECWPDADLQVSIPDQYWIIETHIEAHRFLQELKNGAEMSYREAVCHWYEDTYLPVIQLIKENGILRDFPGRTETDLYLWIFCHRAVLEKKLGWHIEAETAAADLATNRSSRTWRAVTRVEKKLLHTLSLDRFEAGPAPGRWREERLAPRQEERLFADILVPLSGDERGWYALDEALLVANREDSRLLGLHIVSSAAQMSGEAALAIKAEFEARCRAANISGELSIETGDIVSTICDRATWADLVIMYPARPPGTKMLSRLKSGSRNVIYCSCRPVLTVPAPAARPERILLAYDGSPKAREGLFVAAYMASRWTVSLTVLTVSDDGSAEETSAEAQRYLEKQEVSATYLSAQGDVAETILATADRQDSNLIVMGGYGSSPIREAVVGTNLDQVLRQSSRPVLICR